MSRNENEKRQRIASLRGNQQQASRLSTLGNGKVLHGMEQECLHAASKGMEVVLEHLGLDISSEGLRDTPVRFVKYLAEFINPVEAERILGSQWAVRKVEHIDGMLVQSRIPFRAICEHHLLPMLGHASVGYIPNEFVVGLSKLPRIVDAIGTSRPWIQEGITEEIADQLDKHLKPKGVMVVTHAEHMCMACRGVNTPGAITSYSKVKGAYLHVPAAREEFFELVKTARL